jgi:hypothetical protein
MFDGFQQQFPKRVLAQRPHVFANHFLVSLSLLAWLLLGRFVGMENLVARVFEPGECNGYRVLAENTVIAYWTGAFIGKFAIVGHGEFDTVTARAADTGAKSAFMFL